MANFGGKVLCMQYKDCYTSRQAMTEASKRTPVCDSYDSRVWSNAMT